jgi:hypothetical protein
MIPGKQSDLNSRMVNEAKDEYLGSWIRRWNKNTVWHDVNLN